MSIYNVIPGITETTNEFPPPVRQALASSTEVSNVINSKVASVSSTIDSKIARHHPVGTTLPTSTSDKWNGRLFFETDTNTLWVCNANVWYPVGGNKALPLSYLGAPVTGYSYDHSSYSPYFYRNGDKIEFNLRIKKTSGGFVHGAVLFQIAVSYRPKITQGSVPTMAIQSGGTGFAQGAACVLRYDGAVALLNPVNTNNVVEIAGSYFI